MKMIQLAMGISDGLQCGNGTRGAIVSRGLIEGGRLGNALGADEHSFLRIAGIGSIICLLSAESLLQLWCTDHRQRCHAKPYNC